MIHVISPHRLAVSGQPGPYPQAGRTAQPPDPGPLLLRVCGGLQPRDQRPITAQHLCTSAHVMLFHAHPATLTGCTAAEAGGSIAILADVTGNDRLPGASGRQVCFGSTR
jgi:hypothetical protein